MTTQVLFNALSYIDRLVRGGFSQEQARASAEALESALSETVATKTDIADLKHEIGSATIGLRADIAAAEGRLKLDIAHTKNDILRWAFGFNLVLIGAIFAILKFVH